MMKISLRECSRERRNIWLKAVHLNPDIYEFCAEAPDEWILEYMRTGFNEDGTIDFIDPSGGPVITKNMAFGDIIVDRIENKEGKFLIYAKE